MVAGRRSMAGCSSNNPCVLLNLRPGTMQRRVCSGVNRVDPATSVTCPLYPQLLSNWCGAAKRRDVPRPDTDPTRGIVRISGGHLTARLDHRAADGILGHPRSSPGLDHAMGF